MIRITFPLGTRQMLDNPHLGTLRRQGYELLKMTGPVWDMYHSQRMLLSG